MIKAYDVLDRKEKGKENGIIVGFLRKVFCTPNENGLVNI
jgi:hypothetical protein